MRRRKQLAFALALAVALCLASATIGFFIGRSADPLHAAGPCPPIKLLLNVWAQRLQLSEQQIERLTPILQRSCDDMLHRFQLIREQMQPVRDQVRAALMAELTDEQRRRYEDMIAEAERVLQHSPPHVLLGKGPGDMAAGSNHSASSPFSSSDGGAVWPGRRPGQRPGAGNFESPLLRVFDQLDSDANGCLGREEIRRGMPWLMQQRMLLMPRTP